MGMCTKLKARNLNGNDHQKAIAAILSYALQN